MEKILASAQKNKSALTIIYKDSKGITQRNILVKQILDGKIIAYCYLRHAKRTFIIENILSCVRKET